MTDDKKLALLILGKAKPAKRAEKASEEDESPSKTDVARELIDAVKAEDAQAVVDAVSALMELCAECDSEDEDLE